MSKATAMNKPLTEMFQKHSFEKIYHCLTRPNPLRPGKKVNCQILSETEWLITNYMAPAKGMGGKKRMISVRSGGWAAETKFKILKKEPNYFFIEAIPKTGRTHQIRQHLQESYRSILGDNIYGGKSAEVPRLMLHAKSLCFKHPATGADVIIEAPYPKDFESVLNSSCSNK